MARLPSREGDGPLALGQVSLTPGSSLARPFPGLRPVVRVGSAPRSQWRDRAGFPPASLFRIARHGPRDPPAAEAAARAREPGARQSLVRPTATRFAPGGAFDAPAGIERDQGHRDDDAVLRRDLDGLGSALPRLGCRHGRPDRLVGRLQVQAELEADRLVPRVRPDPPVSSLTSSRGVPSSHPASSRARAGDEGEEHRGGPPPHRMRTEHRERPYRVAPARCGMLSRMSAPTDRTQVHRLPERGVYDRETIDAILDEALICHVAFTDGAGAPDASRRSTRASATRSTCTARAAPGVEGAAGRRRGLHRRDDRRRSRPREEPLRVLDELPLRRRVRHGPGGHRPRGTARRRPGDRLACRTRAGG